MIVILYIFFISESFLLFNNRYDFKIFDHPCAIGIILISEGESRLFVGTDMGIMTIAAKEALSRATCAILEANHDPVLLQTSDRPLSLKQRIAGRCGHLSNDQTAEALLEARPSHLSTLLLAHLSQQCNADYLALEAARAALAEIGMPNITLAVLSQDAPSDLYEF